ncbi:GntR family transcriptional regulator [Bordetella petrii]|uniref:GntR family transcriptional regulator n=1 Tax=Bordetella petrii TaxID=94624 RepID=UPI001E621478|nr:GntR family transcriptional regulator [Bordetella petrii]MCD0503931.1 GntR family transcriptional regulator [Bordetella petrii]
MPAEDFMAKPSDSAFEKPSTLRSRVEDYLRSAIMQGRLKGGDRLRETELCEQLGISRPTLREAMRTLEAERLITIEPHRGPTVVRITAKAARDLYALRALLEGYAAHEFARLASDADIERLRLAVQALHECARQADQGRLLAAKREFYDVLLAGCDNDLVKDMLPGLLSRINLLRATSFASPQRLPQSLVEIDRIFARIQGRDPAGAQEAARDHIVNAERTALEMLRRQQEETEDSEPDHRDPAGRRGPGTGG